MSNEFYCWGRLGEQVMTPWQFLEDKGRLTGVPKGPCQQKHELCSDPISADPICPFPRLALRAQGGTGGRSVHCIFLSNNNDYRDITTTTTTTTTSINHNHQTTMSTCTYRHDT